ncbi:MAG: hypothetical protein FWE53_04520 [Firmicutes bacterium]|nr:hypothetical protein [Bacillota bacterium]
MAQINEVDKKILTGEISMKECVGRFGTTFYSWKTGMKGMIIIQSHNDMVKDGYSESSLEASVEDMEKIFNLTETTVGPDGAIKFDDSPETLTQKAEALMAIRADWEVPRVPETFLKDYLSSMRDFVRDDCPFGGKWNYLKQIQGRADELTKTASLGHAEPSHAMSRQPHPSSIRSR